VRHLAEGLAEYARLQPRYGRYWARGRLRRMVLVEAPGGGARAGPGPHRRLAAGGRPADRRLQACEEELVRLKWLAMAIGQVAESRLDYALVSGSGPVLGTFCAILPGTPTPGCRTG
jgi:V/A-type H+/Na+-transporting ATPase subunit I